MQHAAAMRALSSLQDARRYVETQLPPHVLNAEHTTSKRDGGVLDHPLRVGQEAALRLAGEKDRKSLIGKLITGYGKTVAVIGAFAARQAADPNVQFLLIVVPNVEQRDSYARESASLYEQLTGKKTEIEEFGDERVINMMRAGKTRIVIANIQQITADFAEMKKLLSVTNRWMVAFDEIQYYAPKKKNVPLKAWSQRASDIMGHPSVRFVMGVSATPVRSDGRLTLFGEWDFEIPPHIALEEKAVRYIRSSLNNYEVDISIDGSGEPFRVKTSEIAKRAAEENLPIPEWEIRHRVRYHGKYVSYLLDDAFSFVNQLRLADKKASMIVFAMTVRHAKFVADAINARYRHESGKPVAVYVGDPNAVDENNQRIGKTAEENSKAIELFKKSELGNDNPYVLVQVHMAGVGFNHPPACVGIFINDIGDSVLLEQEIGRLLRHTKKLPYAYIFASSDHPGKELFTRMATQYGDKDIDVESRQPDPLEHFRQSNGGDRWPHFPSWALLNVNFAGSEISFPWGEVNPEEISERQIEEVKSKMSSSVSLEEVEQAMQAVFAKRREEQTVREKLTGAKALVVEALTSVARHMERYRQFDMPPSGYAGDVKRACNTAWKRWSSRGHEAMTVDDFYAKHRWLESVAESIRRGAVPGWMP